jgi:hypothetical protein
VSLSREIPSHMARRNLGCHFVSGAALLKVETVAQTWNPAFDASILLLCYKFHCCLKNANQLWQIARQSPYSIKLGDRSLLGHHGSGLARTHPIYLPHATSWWQESDAAA